MLPKKGAFLSKRTTAINILRLTIESRKVKMPEKQERNALEMASSIGVDPIGLNSNWSALSRIDLNSALNHLGSELREEFGIEAFEWQKIVAQAGSWLIDGLDQKIVSIQEKVVEENTATELRKMFGQPLSLLAMPVFVELEKMELLSKIKLKQEAEELTEFWEQINYRVLYFVQLFLAEQLNKVEEERLAHESALHDSKAEAEGMGLLSGTIQEIEIKFRTKIAELEKNKNSLLDSFENLRKNAVLKVQRAFETTIFSASKMKIASTPV